MRAGTFKSAFDISDVDLCLQQQHQRNSEGGERRIRHPWITCVIRALVMNVEWISPPTLLRKRSWRLSLSLQLP